MILIINFRMKTLLVVVAEWITRLLAEREVSCSNPYCHPGHQVGRCRIGAEPEKSIACRQETQGKYHLKSKTGVTVDPEKVIFK